MDTTTAVVEVIKALAWPGVALTAILVFRHPLLQLLSTIRSLKFAGAELTVAAQVEEVKAIAQDIPSPPAAVDNSTTESKNEVDRLLEVADIEPRAAIMAAWRKVEISGVNAVRRSCPADIPKALNVAGTFAEALRRYEVISPSFFVAISKLRNIRNQAIHTHYFEIDPSTARDYVETAIQLARDLDATVTRTDIKPRE
ncbi:MAG TPA: hypothetical protein PK586_01870 [Casimicrobium sp.]|nr:hypothetical protein [Casimicrobium sp.]